MFLTPVVSVGRLLGQGFEVSLGKELHLKTPEGSNLELHRCGSLLFMCPRILNFEKSDYEFVSQVFHEQFRPDSNLVAPTSFKPVYYHADRWQFDSARNTLVRHHKSKALFTPEGTSDRPVTLEQLADERRAYMTHSDGREEVVVDNWRTLEEPHKAYADFWKGRTEFVLASRPTGKKLTGKQSTLPQPRNVQLEPVAADATSAAQPASSAASSSRPPQRTVAEPSASARASANGGYRDDFRRKLQMASEGNMDNIRKMVLEQMKWNDPETGLPYTHDFWLSTSLMWIRFHHVPRSTMFVPAEVELQDGPPQEELGNGRMTMVLTDAGDQWHEDTWDFNDPSAKCDIGVTFTGETCFERKEHEMFEPLAEAEEGDVQARVARGLLQPKQPTELERAEHFLTHLPFRSWRTRCVQAKSRQNHSAKLRTKQPVLQMDYSFITDPSGNQLTLLNVNDVLSGLGMSCVVPNKGYSVYARAELRRFVLGAGRTFGVLQCDPEPSKAVAEEVTSDLGGLRLRTSAVEWKQAQGAVGNTQQLLYAQIRTLRKDLQERYGREIELTSPIMTWLVRHSQWLLNRYAIRSDGLTPFERRWSRRYTSAICRFGGVVLFRVSGGCQRLNLPGSLVSGSVETPLLICTSSEPLLA